MKIAITSFSDSLESKMDPRFGRCTFFVIHDTSNGTTEFIKNLAKDASGGSGLMAAKTLANTGAEKIFSGDFGPKASSVLNSVNIEMVQLKDDNKTIKELIELIK